MKQPFNKNAAVEEDLAVLAQTKHYRSWLFSHVQPFLGTRILEIGAGIGNYSDMLVNSEKLWLTDYDLDYVELLRNKYQNLAHISCHCLDLEKPDLIFLNSLKAENIDTILLMNVLEHIKNDSQAISLLADYIPIGAKIVIEVPAMQSLFSTLDEAYGHFRRYNQREIERLAKETNLSIETFFYYNFLGALGWFISKMLGQQRLSKQAVFIFDTLVPILRPLEKLVTPPFGNSMLIVLKKEKNIR